MFFTLLDWMVTNDYQVLEGGGAMSSRDPGLLNQYMEKRCPMTRNKIHNVLCK